MRDIKLELEEAIQLITSLIKPNHPEYDFWQRKKEKFKERLESLRSES